MNQAENKIVRVVSAILDTKELTLYLVDGSTVTIQQGDPRVKRIVDEITPKLAGKQGAVAEVNLDYDKTTTFADFEKKTNGVVKFFRVAKAKLKNFLQTTEELVVESLTPRVIGLPAAGVMVEPEDESEEDDGIKQDEDLNEVEEAKPEPKTELTPVEKLQAATADILKHAVPVTSHHFADHHVSDTQDKHALVAVVDDKVIPNAQNLHTQIKHVVDGAESTGLVNLMKRLATVKRGHSVDDLMKFLKHGDLPIADDGSIIIYKRLNTSESSLGDFVDVHSGKVNQSVGDIVCMAEELVDHNRRIECSNGLHVARRQYLHSFSGNRMVLAKVNPEDVIAVPEYDANKMRVCGYHILFEIPRNDAAKLSANRPIVATDETAVLLARALAGDYPPAKRKVEITGHKGEGMVYTSLAQPGEKKPRFEPKEDLVPVAALEDQQVADPSQATGPKIDPSKVVEKVAPVEPVKLTRQEETSQLVDTIMFGTTNLEKTEAATKLDKLRKEWKKSWSALGLNEKQTNTILKLLGTPAKAPQKPAKKAKPKAEPKVAPTPVKASVTPVAPVGPKANIAAKLEAALAGDKALAAEILQIKKAAKKSWDILGVTAVQVQKLDQIAKK